MKCLTEIGLLIYCYRCFIFIILAGIQAVETYQEQLVVMFSLIMTQLKAVSIARECIATDSKCTYMTCYPLARPLHVQLHIY